MSINIYSLILIILLSSFSTFGQKKAVTKPQVPVSETEATTKEGKKVILKSDGTWVFATTESKLIETTSIYIDTKLPADFGRIDVNSYFYLISTALEKVIATESLLEIYSNEEKSLKEELRSSSIPSANHLFFTMENFEKLYPIYSNEARKEFKKVIKFQRSAILADREKVIFDDVPRGKYFLIGLIKTAKWSAIPSLARNTKCGI